MNYKVYLDSSNFRGSIKFVSKKETNYGYIVKLMTNYITLFTKKIYITNGFVKIVTIVDRNYSKKYQTTTYYDKEGNEIIEKTTRAEAIKWRKLQNTNN